MPKKSNVPVEPKRYYPHEVEKDLKECIFNTVSRAFANMHTTLYEANVFDVRNDEDYNDVSSDFDDNSLASQAFNEMNNKNLEYNLTDSIDTSNIKLREIRDRNLYEAWRQKTDSVLKRFEDRIEEICEDDEVGLKEKEFLYAFGLNKVKRALKGYGDQYLATLVPLVSGINAIGACIESRITGNPDVAPTTLREKIEKFGDKYPLYDIFINGDKAVQIFADYLDEKKKTGKVSPEHEEQYRKVLYSYTLKLIDAYQKLENAITDKKDHDEMIAQNVLAIGNDPFHLHTQSARGCAPATTALHAYKNGLECGWPIEDLGVLAAFYLTITKEKSAKECNQSMNLKGFEEYDNPKYKDKDHEKYIQEMDDYYKDLCYTKLESAAQRKEILEKMNKYIDDGLKKGYFSDTGDTVDYFKTVYGEARYRDRAIERGDEPAFHYTLREGEEPQDGKENLHAIRLMEDASEIDKINLFSIKLNTKRSRVFFGAESDEHKNLRLAAEDYKKHISHEPDYYVTDKNVVAMYLIERLEKLDELEYRAKIYVDEKRKKGVNTGAGEDRLKGGEEAQDFVREAKRRFLQDIVKYGYGLKGESLEKIRMDLTGTKAMFAGEKIGNLNSMPRTEEEKNNLKSLVADIMVDKFAKSDAPEAHNAFKAKGAISLKKDILLHNDFKNLMNSYFNDRNMTPQKLVSELESNEVLHRMNRLNGKLRNEENDRVRKTEEKMQDRVRRNIASAPAKK